MPKLFNCVFGCKTLEGCIPVHKFPSLKKYPDIFRIWVKICGERLNNVTDEQITKNRKICDIHFSDAHVNRGSRINRLAVPTVNLPPDSQEILKTIELPKPHRVSYVEPVINENITHGDKTKKKKVNSSNKHKYSVIESTTIDICSDDNDGYNEILDSVPSPQSDSENNQNVTDAEIVMETMDGQPIFKKKITIFQNENIPQGGKSEKKKQIKIKNDDDGCFEILDSAPSPQTDSVNNQNVTDAEIVMETMDGQPIFKKKITFFQSENIPQGAMSDNKKQMKIKNPKSARRCVVCMTTNQYLIPVNKDEGKQNDLYEKIYTYLPISVLHNDVICFPCATSLVSFHNLINSCKKAHGILTNLKNEKSPVNENTPQLDPEQSCKGKITCENAEGNDVNLSLNMYDYLRTEKPWRTKLTVCPYSWREIKNILTSNSQGSYTCHLCSECLPNIEDLHQHFESCSQCICSKCLCPFSDVEMLRKHFDGCTKYVCNTCPTFYKLKSGLLAHYEQNHPTSICNLCHQTFVNDLECDQHKLHKHKFLCELCDNSFESTLEGVRYRHSIFPEDRLLCLSCYGVYQYMVKTIDCVKDKPVLKELSEATNIDETMMSLDGPTIDVTVRTSGSTAINVEKYHDPTARGSTTIFNSPNIVEPNDHLYAKVVDPLSCVQCSKIFAFDQALQLHILRNHPCFTCPDCAGNFESYKELKKHKQHDCILECGDCGKKCKGRGSLKTHSKAHSGRRFKCNACDKEYPRKERLIYHIRQIHMQEELVCCPICGILVNKYKYSEHKSRKHGKRKESTKLHQCHVCNKNFKSRTSLRVHSQTAHNQLRPFLCNICPSIFKLERYLKLHVTKCHPPTHNVCRFCLKVFYSLEEFDQHFTQLHKNFSKFILLDNGEGYHCAHCEKIFDSSKAMFAHSKEMDGKSRSLKPKTTYKCVLCEKDLTTKRSLLNHIRIIHKRERRIKNKDERNYQCSYCPNKFKRNDAKIAHERIHLGEKPFSCSVCSRNFRQKSDMKRHEARHNTEPGTYEARHNTEPGTYESRHNTEPGTYEARHNTEPETYESRHYTEPGTSFRKMDSLGHESKGQRRKKTAKKRRVDSALFDWPMPEDLIIPTFDH